MEKKHIATIFLLIIIGLSGYCSATGFLMQAGTTKTFEGTIELNGRSWYSMIIPLNGEFTLNVNIEIEGGPVVAYLFSADDVDYYQREYDNLYNTDGGGYYKIGESSSSIFMSAFGYSNNYPDHELVLGIYNYDNLFDEWNNETISIVYSYSLYMIDPLLSAQKDLFILVPIVVIIAAVIIFVVLNKKE